MTEKISTYPGDIAVSNTLSYRINNNNTDAICSTRAVSVEVDGLTYKWTISQIATQAYPFSDTEMILKNSLLYSVTFNATPYQILVHSSGYTLYKPELTLKMTNGGTNNTYYGAFYTKGLGTSVSTTDLSTLIDLGYNTALIFSGTFSFGTFKSILSSAVKLSKSWSGSQYSYLSETVSLSNPSGNIYSRQCSLQAPYELQRPGNYYEMHVGLKSVSSDATYSVSVSYNF